MQSKRLLRILAVLCTLLILGGSLYSLVIAIASSARQQVAYTSADYQSVTVSEDNPSVDFGADGKIDGLRDLIFYFPGHAPSSDLEYDPIPYTDLIPGRSFDGDPQPVEHEE